MATKIDEHRGDATMGSLLFKINLHADVMLTEDEAGKFAFEVNYSYEGAKSGRGHTSVQSLTGDTKGDYDCGSDTLLHYSVSGWDVNKEEVSCKLSASIEHTSFPKMGPANIFKDQVFKGHRRSLLLRRVAEDFDRHCAAEEALTRLIGAE